jgi:hypothetical protein
MCALACWRCTLQYLAITVLGTVAVIQFRALFRA